VFFTDIQCFTIIKTLKKLRDKVTEFYGKMNDFSIEFTKMIEHRPKLEIEKGNSLIQK